MNAWQASGKRETRQMWGWVVIGLLGVTGCGADAPRVDGSIAAYRDRLLSEHRTEVEQRRSAPAEGPPRVTPVAWQGKLDEREALVAEPAIGAQPAPESILIEIPDPSQADDVFGQRLAKLREEQAHQQDQRVVRNFERVVEHATEYLEMLRREEQVRLGLAECVQRALEHNYTIRREAHNPAISQTQVVEAEAAFDVEFFLDSSYANLDQATAQAFVPSKSDTRSIEGGFRKLLPSGMQAQVSLSQDRSKNSLPEEFQQLNPVYNSNFVVQLNQPLLRGFGLDVNRAQIELAKTDYRISKETFIQQVRDTLVSVEQAYWRLAQARRAVSILAETVSQNYVTWQNMIERLDHDATQVEVSNAESRFQTAYVNYLENIKLVKDSEDALKNLLNDPALLLSENVELIPTEVPLAAPTAIDLFAAVRTALDERSEIHAAREAIEGRRISTNAAKNGILPKLDISFRYEVQGIGDTSDNSFDNLTTNRFISYTVGASFAYNFGERKARAAWRRARLQEAQAVVQLNQVTDGIVQEVNERVRTLMVRYEQIPPALTSVQAAERNLRSLQARTQRIDPSYLQTELGAVEQLANTRSTLLQVITDYNIGLIELEKAQGTLLEYNNVAVTDESGT